MVSRVLLCVWVVLNLAGICRAPAPARGTGVCGACVPLARCPPVARILEGYPYSTHSYFYAAVSCGTVLAPFVCCDADVVRRALAAETEAARAHAVVYLGIPRTAYGGGGLGGDTAAAAACAKNAKFRTIGREEPSTGVFPWMAKIGFRVNSSRVEYICAGALVTARSVLTTALCLVMITWSTDKDIERALVTLGTDGTATQNFTQVLLVPHPAYDWKRPQNNIGLVRLARPAVFTDTVMPICLQFGELPVDLEQLPPRAMLVAGLQEHLSGSMDWRLYSGLTYEPRAQCSKFYSQHNITIEHDQFCTVGLPSDYCAGYSGTPVFVWEGEGGGARAVGLVANNAHLCGSADATTVYTRIDAYRRWIEDNLAV